MRMHRYTIEGQDDSDEADASGSRWESPGRGSRPPSARIAGLSKDLYTVSDPPPTQPPEPMNPQTQGKLVEAYDARERGEWDRGARTVRRLGKFARRRYSPTSGPLSGKRPGDTQVAKIFIEHACRLDPQNQIFQAMLLNVLKQTNPEQARTKAGAILRESEKRATNIVIEAAHALYGEHREHIGPRSRAIYQRLISILRALLSRTKDEEGLEHPTHVSMILFLLAMCHRGLGEMREAFDYYSRPLCLNQEHTILISRGHPRVRLQLDVDHGLRAGH